MPEQLMIVEPGVKGYILENGTTSVSEITDADFVTPSSVTFQDGYFIVSEDKNDQFNLSDSYDGTSWSSLQYATAESKRDVLVRVISFNREIWMFGEKTIEIWYNSGAYVPFDRTSGGIIHIGCKAGLSVASTEDYLCFLDNYGSVRMITSGGGYDTQIISTRQVEYELDQTSDGAHKAFAFAYTQQRHSFYYISTPKANKAWVYDLTTGLWHTRTRCSSGLGTGDVCQGETAPNINCYAFYKGMHLVGHPSNGKIYMLDFDTYQDAGDYMEAERSTPVVHAGRQRTFCHEVELIAETGAETSEPTVYHSHSNDRGNTWTSEIGVGMGTTGDYDKRLIWRRRGKFKQRIFKWRMVANAHRFFKEAHAHFTKGAA